MSGPAEELLLAAAADIGKTVDDVRPYIRRIVDEDWYATAKSLRWVTTDEWRAMKIPGCLLHAIERRLGPAVSAPPADQITGLTLRVGRAFYSLCDKIEDVRDQRKSTLVIGQAGVGKRTILREMSRILSDR